MLGAKLEFNNYTGRYPGVILSSSEDTGVDPVSLENTPVKGSDDFRINATADSNSKGIIGNGREARSRRASVSPSNQDMSERRNTRRPRDLRPEHIVSGGRMGAVVTRKIADRAQPGEELVLTSKLPTVLIE